jgi:predicted metal-binding membrane protein
VTYEPRKFGRVRNAALLASAIAWVLLLFDSGGTALVAHCLTAAGATPRPASFQMLLAMNPPAALAIGWAVMLVAMMAPVLIAPICHIHLRSFTSRRTRSAALFVSAYAAVWMALGCGLLTISLAAAWFAPQSYLPAAGAAIVALVWQASPIKQRCLNACNAHKELAAFGVAADYSAVRFGLTHAVWCAGSCWVLMLFPILLFRGHLPAMAVVTILISSERLDPPMVARWRWRGLSRVSRIAIAQARIRLQSVNPVSASLTAPLRTSQEDG